jgi:hypothetical protein
MTKIADLLDSDFSGPGQDHFNQSIDLSPAGLREVVARGVLEKKQSREPILRELFRDRGESLMQNVRLELCSRRTGFDEDEFVRFYPYLPYLIDLSIDIMAGIRTHPNARGQFGGDDAFVRQVLEMLVSDRTRLAEQPVGVLVSIDKIYELVEGNIALKKHKDVLDIEERFEWDQDYPGMAGRVAKAICLMEFVKTDLPRSTKNIASLLVHRVTEARPTNAVAAILYHLKQAGRVRETEEGWQLSDYDELRRAAASLEHLGKAVGAINPRRPGWHNHLIQLAKKALARLLVWYTRPLQEFNASVSRSLEELASAVDRISANVADQHSRNSFDLEQLSMSIVALEGRMAHLEKRSAILEGSMHREVELLQEQVKALGAPPRAAEPEAPASRTDTGVGSHRTTYFIGLFGSGRRYINELLLQNLGERVKYFRDTIHLHPGPTPMIYSGHATIKHVSRFQELPAVMSSILEAVRSGFADSIFIYRHPLDSLLTNWVWWRSYLHDKRAISGISQVYRNVDDLSAELEENFCEFLALAEGNPDFFAAAPGARFLSFAEFVEETELHLQSAPLGLRLEDFMADPLKEFSKIAAVMSLDLAASSCSIAPPQSKPYGYLAVRKRVPQFRNFINELDAETKERIERIGYSVKG